MASSSLLLLHYYYPSTSRESSWCQSWQLTPKIGSYQQWPHILYVSTIWGFLGGCRSLFTHTSLLLWREWLTIFHHPTFIISAVHTKTLIFLPLCLIKQIVQRAAILSILRHGEFVHLDQIPINSHNVVSVLNFVFATPFGARGCPAQRNLLLRSETLLRMELRQVLRMCRVSIIY